MTLTLTLSTETAANLMFAAARAGRSAETLAADAVASAMVAYQGPRELATAKDALALKAVFDKAKDGDTKSMMLATVSAEAVG